MLTWLTKASPMPMLLVTLLMMMEETTVAVVATHRVYRYLPWTRYRQVPYQLPHLEQGIIPLNFSLMWEQGKLGGRWLRRKKWAESGKDQQTLDQVDH